MTSSDESKIHKKQSKTNGEPQAESEVWNFDKPDFKFVPEGHCQYRQQGPYLVCQTCLLQHAVYIGMDKILVGLDKKGKPMLKSRLEV